MGKNKNRKRQQEPATKGTAEQPERQTTAPTESGSAPTAPQLTELPHRKRQKRFGHN